MYYQVKDSHGGKPATGTGIGLPFLVVWRKIWAAILRLPANRAKVQPYVDDPRTSVAEEVDDAFDEDDMPLPALNVLLVEDIELNVIVARSVLEKLG